MSEDVYIFLRHGLVYELWVYDPGNQNKDPQIITSKTVKLHSIPTTGRDLVGAITMFELFMELSTGVVL